MQPCTLQQRQHGPLVSSSANNKKRPAESSIGSSPIGEVSQENLRERSLQKRAAQKNRAHRGGKVALTKHSICAGQRPTLTFSEKLQGRNGTGHCETWARHHRQGSAPAKPAREWNAKMPSRVWCRQGSPMIHAFDRRRYLNTSPARQRESFGRSEPT